MIKKGQIVETLEKGAQEEMIDVVQGTKMIKEGIGMAEEMATLLVGTHMIAMAGIITKIAIEIVIVNQVAIKMKVGPIQEIRRIEGTKRTEDLGTDPKIETSQEIEEALQETKDIEGAEADPTHMTDTIATRMANQGARTKTGKIDKTHAKIIRIEAKIDITATIEEIRLMTTIATMIEKISKVEKTAVKMIGIMTILTLIALEIDLLIKAVGIRTEVIGILKGIVIPVQSNRFRSRLNNPKASKVRQA